MAGETKTDVAKSNSNVLYYSLLLDEKSKKIIMENKDILDTKTITTDLGVIDKKWNYDVRAKKIDFHVTMLFVGGKTLTDPEDIAVETSILPLIGQSISIKTSSLVSNEKASALTVNKTFPCRNTFPHITLLLSKGIMPVYSNELAKLANENTALSKPLDLELSGVVHVITKKK